MNCPNCGMELGHETEYCINCGAKQAKAGRFSAKKREQGMFNKDVVTGSSTYTPDRTTPVDVRKSTGDGGRAATDGGSAAGKGSRVSRARRDKFKKVTSATLLFIAWIGIMYIRDNFVSKPDAYHTETAEISVGALDVTYNRIDVYTSKTVFMLLFDNTAGNIALPNGENSYEYNAAVLCDGQEKEARIHLRFVLRDENVELMCEATVESDDLFEAAYFSMPLVIDGESAMHDVNITVDEFDWTD